jgi:hypothetical protein
MDTVEDKICYKLKLVRNGNLSLLTDTGALLKKARSTNNELDKSMIDIFFSNYEERDGFKFPFSR